ncbi:MAG TPA: hypothetical protein VFQ75_13195 [Candidatus Limnocylindrales bacterium]|jgi:hypothetical protein|nr:hypothetical protein [Candidatus Limnocylindrales bacterium]
MTTLHIRARLSPWDDQAFVKAFEQARDEVERTDSDDAGPVAAVEVERRLHVAGYPNARIDVVRSVSEALEHASHWDVRRDG